MLLLVVGCHHSDEPSAVLSTTSADGGALPSGKSGKTADGAEPPKDLPELPKEDGASIVDLDGNSRPWPPPVPETTSRIAAVAVETPILAEPDVFSARLGQLRAGAVVEIDPKPVTGKGCGPGFRQIKPMGYVCLGTTTLDLTNAIVKASWRRPDVTEKLPYIYGIAVRGGPAYARLPTEKETKELEPHIKTHLAKWAKDDVSGAAYGLDLWGKWRKDPLPPALVAMHEKKSDPLPFFLEGNARVPNLSGLTGGDTPKAGEFAHHNGVAFVDTFLSEGRRWNVAVDLRLMPADRFRPIRGSDFHGVRIGDEVKMPFAFVRGKNTKRMTEENGKLVPGDALEWRSAHNITGKRRIQRGKTYTELEDGTWVPDEDLSRVDVAKKMPGWANEGEKWIDINITRQVLTAYEGTKPVYSTLVSTGEAGLDDPKTTKSTARGIYRIHTKYLTATMDSKTVGEEFELRDVPYVQYFHEGYALHAAYWHDVFGQPKSHGCINLAPEDARRLFFWTEPHVPAGWHGASKGKGTVVFIHA